MVRALKMHLILDARHASCHAAIITVINCQCCFSTDLRALCEGNQCGCPNWENVLFKKSQILQLFPVVLNLHSLISAFCSAVELFLPITPYPLMSEFSPF